MRRAGIQGALRSKRVRITRRDESTGRHPDLVKRRFTASAPNQLWVTDLTLVATWAGIAYGCFIVDAFSRRIVGWRVAIGAVSLIGSVGDSYDNALAETVNGYYKAELIRGPARTGP